MADQKSPAGSATGFDLARALDALESYHSQESAGFAHVQTLRAALALATPQHSVTEHEAFKAAMVAKHYVGSMFDYFLAEGEITYHDPVANQMYDAWQAARAQPFPSTAATQPEQNDIDMVKGALDLCEPEEQQAFQRILAIVKGANRG